MKPVATIALGVLCGLALLPLAPIILPLLAAWAILANHQAISDSVSGWVTETLTPPRDQGAAQRFLDQHRDHKKGLR